MNKKISVNNKDITKYLCYNKLDKLNSIKERIDIMDNNLEKAIRILTILHENNHEAYIVGGYVRDKLLGKKSNDIDISTSATPKEIMELFPNTESPNYGSIRIIYKNTNFDITTFRRDIKYEDNRLPVKIKYIKSLKKDLLRRDFTINTICMDKDKNIIDVLNAKIDLEKKVIKISIFLKRFT